MKRFLLFCFFLIQIQSVAQLKLARLFSDHVVLQRQKPIPVWGWASPNEKLTVTLATQKQLATADASGKWSVKFAPMEAGGPHQMTVLGKTEKLEVNDILMGEVWLCSGQSNMEWPVRPANTPLFCRTQRHARYPIRLDFGRMETLQRRNRGRFYGHWIFLCPRTHPKT